MLIFFVSFLALTSSVFWFLVSLLLSLPFIFWGLYIFLGMKHAPHLVTPFTLQQWEEDIAERRKVGAVAADVELLYWRLWRKYVMAYVVSGPTFLEGRIHSYVSDGLTLDEAIKKLAKLEII